MTSRGAVLQLVLAVGAAVLPFAGVAAATPCDRAPGLGRGFHLGESYARDVSDYRDMAQAGAGLLRLGVALHACQDCTRYEWPEQALQGVRRNLDLARVNGLRVVLVLRPPAEPESALWASPDLQRSLSEIWQRLAKEFRGRAEVAAFDLVNEPHPPGAGFPAKQATWEDLAVRLIRVVRAEDPSRTLVIEPSPGARPLWFSHIKALPFENLVYSIHMYEPFEVTHQRVNAEERFAGVYRYPGPAGPAGLWNQERMRQELAPVKRFADEHRVEIFVGEFGAIRWAPDGSRERYLKDLTELMNEYRWSWTYHAFREWHGWDAEMGPSENDRMRRRGDGAYRILSDAMVQCSGAVHGR